MERRGLICRLTFAIVRISCSSPFMERYCACTGIMTWSAAASALIVSIPSEGIQSRMIASYSPRTVFRYCRRIVSRLMVLTRVTSMPASSMFAGSRSTPSAWWRIPLPGGSGLSVIIPPRIAESVVSIWSGCWYPRLAVMEPCESTSTRRTLLPSRARPIPMLMELTVFAQPPFWLHKQ